MDRRTYQVLLREAIRIGDLVLGLSVPERRGVAWRTLCGDTPGALRWGFSPWIYQGVSGIVLFLLALHRLARTTRHLAAAVEAARWLESLEAEEVFSSPGFHCGSVGVAYALCHAYSATGDEHFRESASRILNHALSNWTANPQRYGLLDGLAGTLLGACHVSAFLKHQAHGQIAAIVVHLADAANLDDNGLSWDRTDAGAAGLCGMAHGAAGVGFSLFEASAFLRSGAPAWLAISAYEYEDNQFDHKRGNWPDLRWEQSLPRRPCGHASVTISDSPADSDPSLYEMIAWCHGAPGIGLARLRAFELTGGQRWIEMAHAALGKTASVPIEAHSPPGSFTLCHGAGGNADLYLEAYRVLGLSHYRDMAQDLAAAALTVKNRYGFYASGYSHAPTLPDLSLFNGQSGIGYFLLRAIDPVTTPSILAPRLRESLARSRTRDFSLPRRFSLIQFKAIVTKKRFRRTLAVAMKQAPDHVRRFLHNSSTASDLLDDSRMETLVTGIITACRLAPPVQLADVYALEIARLRMERAAGAAHLSVPPHAAEETRRGEGQTITRSHIDRWHSAMDLTLALSSSAMLLNTSWRWPLGRPQTWSSNLHSSPGQHCVLLHRSAGATKEYWLRPLAASLLQAFTRPSPVGIALSQVSASVLAATTMALEDVHHLVLSQMLQAIGAGILTRAGSSETLAAQTDDATTAPTDHVTLRSSKGNCHDHIG